MGRSRNSQSETQLIEKPAAKRGRPRKSSAVSVKVEGQTPKKRGRKPVQKLATADEEALIRQIDEASTRLTQLPRTALSLRGRQRIKELLIEALYHTRTQSYRRSSKEKAT